MKYSELKEREAQGLTSLYLAILTAKAVQAHEYTKSGLQLLVVGNGSGIALLGTLMVSLAQRGVSYRSYVMPVAFFVAGAVFAALMYVPLVSVTDGAVTHIGESLEKFFKGEVSARELQGWGFTLRGRVIFRLLFIASLCSFFIAVVWTLTLLLRG